MKKKIVFLPVVFVLLFYISAIASEPGEYGHFSNIYVFGDSLSDNGKFIQILGPIEDFFPYYYWEGRWSNGPIWAEYLAKKAHANLIDFAVGTATTGESTDGMFYPFVPTVLDQINEFCSSAVTIPPDSLFIVEGGYNDFIRNPFGSPSAAVGNIISGVELLRQTGARHILVMNLIDMGTFPLYKLYPPNFPPLMSAVTQEFNNILADAVSDYALANPDITISLADFYEFNAAVSDEPWRYSLKNVTDESSNASSIANTVADFTSKHYLFWDFVHPTTDFHEILADFIGTFLKNIEKDKAQ